MVRFFATLIILIVASLTTHAEDLITLSSDKAGYVLGERAFLKVKINSQPLNPDNEYYFQSTFQDEGQKIVMLSDTEAFAVSNPLDDFSSKIWEVSLYIQNKKRAEEYNATIAFFRQKNLEIDEKLNKETSQSNRDILTQQKIRNEQIIVNSQAKLQAGRTFLQTKTLILTLDTLSPILKKSFVDPTIEITPDDPSKVYDLGEVAKFNVAISNATTDTELIVKGEVPTHQGRIPIILTKSTAANGSIDFTTATLNTGDEGRRKFIANVSYRSRSEAAYYRNIVIQSETRKGEYIILKSKTQDERKKAYYDMLIAELDRAIVYNNEKLHALLVKINDNSELAFRVRDPNLIIGFVLDVPTADLQEGSSTAKLKIKLNYEPDGNIFVDITPNQTPRIDIAWPSSLMFTPENWNEYQEVPIEAIADDYFEGTHSGEVTISSSGPDYDGLTAGPFSFNILDKQYSYVGLSLNSTSACAIKGKRLVCWGDGFDYVLGNGSQNTLSVPTVVTNYNEITKIGSGYHHRCFINDGAAYCWGQNGKGQIGVGGYASHVTTPTLVPGLDSGVTDIAGGSYHTCAIKWGTVYCWGDNSTYQMGKGGSATYDTPQSVSLPITPVMLSIGANNTCAVSAAGTAYCWGEGVSGSMGMGNTATWINPTLSTHITGVISITSSPLMNVRCFNNGTRMKCVGSNGWRQIGNSAATANIYTVPQEVEIPSAPSSMASSGFAHVCGVFNGSAYCWGSVGLNMGLLGNGTAGGSATPQLVSNVVPPVSEISASTYQTCLTDQVGTKCWGSSTVLGDGSGQSSNIPVQILEPTL
ncbi:hypothetical protein QJS83_16620 [Bdellovibrio sp. 22V]|uniref:RCC1 domain-containing protein n=1 Tax=Bdellovibrio sp. 22V TaxID=3044166 RepID=UPI00254397B8|nr:hypothetical protein [Bdellovibrio sp. 22V]WII72087.1 hypothetical protein QJS83_16620 [Bdellovibrio sp. 22V]